MQFIFQMIGEKSAMSSVGWDVIFCAIIAVTGTRRIKYIAFPFVISLGGAIVGILSIFSREEHEVKSKDIKI